MNLDPAPGDLPLVYASDSDLATVAGDSGEIRLAKRLDRENQSEAEIVVTATNAEGKLARLVIGLDIADVNDNWPVFTRGEFQRMAVKIGAGVGSRLPAEGLVVGFFFV